MKKAVYKLYINDNSKLIKDSILIGTYNEEKEIPKINNTVCTIEFQ
jgi:hypothetical protein